MTPDATGDVDRVMTAVRAWPPERKRELLRALAESCSDPRSRPPVPAIRVEDWIGLGVGDEPTPDDETVKSWIDEHRMAKYG